MRIYLLRHGRAEAGFDMSDSDRALTIDGRKKLQQAAPIWTRLIESIETIVTSPLVRARETAAVLISALEKEPEVRIEEWLTPAADPQLAMDLVAKELAAGTDSIAFVGHEPHLGELLGLLLSGTAGQPIPLKKGMLVAVDTKAPTSLICSLRFALGQKTAAELG